jgi:uncharacterized membrane protein YcaP (DUF421 family)
MENILEFLGQILSVGDETGNWYQTALRAILIYFSALLFVRIGEKRFMGKNTAFDVILGVIFGSVISRAINSTGAIFETLVASLVLVVLHWLSALISFHSDHLGDFFKGSTRQLISDGEIMWDEMQKSHISKKDLMGQLRSEGNTEDIDSVKKAILERSGEISVIKADKEPKIIEVSVAEGVQTIRIRLE